MKLALQDHLTGFREYEKVFEVAKATGFDGVEGTHFGEALSTEVTKEVFSASNKFGMPVSAVCGGYPYSIGGQRTQRAHRLYPPRRQSA